MGFADTSERWDLLIPRRGGREMGNLSGPSLESSKLGSTLQPFVSLKSIRPGATAPRHLDVPPPGNMR